ncbi:MAG: 16S rRNA (cytosine(1402)-N(4))-methyltransferase [Flavobacteriales bacterium AspAUS03]
MKPVYHKPVLLDESTGSLIIDPGCVYIDATSDGGVDSGSFLKRLDAIRRLLSFDQDEETIQNNGIRDERFGLFHQNFRYMQNVLRLHHISVVSGILSDLGVSWHQFDIPNRGFSTRFDHRFDMQMNCYVHSSVLQVVGQYLEEVLIEIFPIYGELKGAKKNCTKKCRKTCRETH